MDDYGCDSKSISSAEIDADEVLNHRLDYSQDGHFSADSFTGKGKLDPFAVAEISEDCPKPSLTDGLDFVNNSDASFIYDDFEPMQYLDEEEAYCQEALDAAIAAAEEILYTDGLNFIEVEGCVSDALLNEVDADFENNYGY